MIILRRLGPRVQHLLFALRISGRCCCMVKLSPPFEHCSINSIAAKPESRNRSDGFFSLC